MSWDFQFNFNDGSGWHSAEDANGDPLVLLPSIQKIETLWKKLKPVAHILRFTLVYDITFFNLIYNYTSNLDISIRVYKDAVFYFRGFISGEWEIDRNSKYEDISIECISYYKKLTEIITQTIDLINYKVCDNDNTSNSIIHYILTLINLDNFISISNIDKIIDSFYIDANTKTFLEALNDLLFEFGYIIQVNTNYIEVQKIAPASITDQDLFTIDPGVTGDTLIPFREKRNYADYDGVNIEYWTSKTIDNTITLSKKAKGYTVYLETENASDDLECQIVIAPGDYYPAVGGDDESYLYYSIQGRGNETPELINFDSFLGTGSFPKPKPLFSSKRVDKSILYVTNPTISKTASGALTEIDYTPDSRKALVKYRNNTPGNITLTEFRINAEKIVYKDIKKAIKIEFIADSNKKLSLETEYIRDNADALYLASALSGYYKNNIFTYTIRSENSYDIGETGQIIDNERSREVDIIIIQKTYDEYREKYTYICEGIAAYSEEDYTQQFFLKRPPTLSPGQHASFSDRFDLMVIDEKIMDYFGTGEPDAPVNGDYKNIRVDAEIITYLRDAGAWVEKSRIGYGAFSGLTMALSSFADVNSLKINATEVITSVQGLQNISSITTTNYAVITEAKTTNLTAAGWYRIATGIGGLYARSGRIKVHWENTAGDTTFGEFELIVSASAGSEAGADIIIPYSGSSATQEFSMIRVLFKGTPDPIYIEIFKENVTACDIRCTGFDLYNFSLITITSGSIPTDYSDYELTVAGLFAARSGSTNESFLIDRNHKLTTYQGNFTDDLVVGGDANVTNDVYATNVYTSVDVRAGGQVAINGGSRMYCYQIAGQSIPPNTPTLLVWDAFSIDNLGEFTPSGFVPVQQGHYNIWASIKTQSRQILSNQYLSLYLYIYPGAIPVALLDEVANPLSGNKYFVLGGSKPVFIGPEQSVSIIFYHTATGPILLTTSSVNNRFEAYRTQ